MTRAEALLWGRDIRRRVPIPAEVLAIVVDRLRRRRTCVDCVELGIDPADIPADVQIHVDHLQALARGGNNHHSNLTLRCEDHNKAKSAGSATATPRRPKWERRRR